MPLPMVHLSVAVTYAEIQGIKDPLGTFYLGNLAPDAIHMREGITKEDKPRTHFFPSEPGDYLSRLKKHYHILINQREERDWTWFVRGYMMHLMTDDLWFRELYPAFVEKNVNLGRTNDEIRTLYYRETDQADFDIYNGKLWRTEVWDVLKDVRSYDFSDLLTSSEILRWRDRTFSFFTDPQKEPKITPHFFTDEVISSFVDRAANQLGVIFEEWDSHPIKEN